MPKPKDLSFLSNVSQIDWARLAAYIDGEGTIRITSVHGIRPTSRRVFYLEVVVANTDPRLPVWLRERFGGGIQRGSNRNNPKWAMCWRWSVGSAHAAAIVDGCYDYFVIKRDQADIARAFQKTILPNRPYGCKGRPQSLVDHQQNLAQQLSDLKGTGAQRGRRNSVASATVQ